ncbi:ABC transporter permease [Meiothermus sp. CFH 77666]|uniref:ABC transporter permease n=1 Tax=Meiothermus sp. CFH 77666 TaxID=2817942 RepID=UPI001AA07150|nr:ABC transporter permease [Meiothermus sp. CFH 77666]MBO1438788.1 ABC transporter permease [Meiothermus sp. CFH 77666]
MLQVAYIEFWRYLRAFFRYPLEVLGGVLGAVVVFALFFSGVRYLAGPALFGERLEALVASLLAWTLAFSLLSYIASTLTEEALAGLLEQLALTRPGLLGVVLVRSAVSLFQIGLLNIPVFLAILLTSGARLDFPPLTLLPLATLFLGALGLGLLLGGLALVYKRVGQIMGLLQFLFLGLFLIRFEALTQPWNALGYLLPLAPSVAALRLLLGQGEDPEWGLLFLAGTNALAYIAFGIGFFKHALRRARRQGTLGTY